MSQPETEHHCHRLASGRFVRLAVEFVPGALPKQTGTYPPKMTRAERKEMNAWLHSVAEEMLPKLDQGAHQELAILAIRDLTAKLEKMKKKGLL